MDPKQALIDADQAVSELDLITALERLQGYFAWRLQGGAEPIMPEPMRGRGLITGDMIADQLMTLAIDRLEDWRAEGISAMSDQTEDR